MILKYLAKVVKKGVVDKILHKEGFDLEGGDEMVEEEDK